MSVEAPLPCGGEGAADPRYRQTDRGRGRVLRPQMSAQESMVGGGEREGVVVLGPAVLRRATSLKEGERRVSRRKNRHSVAFTDAPDNYYGRERVRARLSRSGGSLSTTHEDEHSPPPSPDGEPSHSQDQGQGTIARGLARVRSLSWGREPGGGGGGGGPPFVQYCDEEGAWRRRSLARGVSRCDPCDHCFKVMLIGDSCVGKTCLLTRFKDGAFLSGTFISTVGIDFRNKVVTVDGSKVKLQIWDTAGQERFRSVTHAYYRDAHALLLLYDVMNKNSYDNTRAWLAEVHEYAQDDVVIMLIGNKCDVNGDRVVRREDGERLAREYNVAFMETSAKTGLNVDLAFLAVARQLKARKSTNPNERRFNVAEYVRQEAKTEGCACNVG
ncbi:ras-related protein Rab-37-like [Portunus trituberculatus]|uniref:ras-related protein Rab-37-like n=1 Tax=Portunus trituberculatus TaxID=210409 RepID=UPI001E1CE520|nr:ras-related protein Rab-37-like [Portunus trituberculatus]XP_045130616.1 ras-related protein Rab-37-like [Portunus trituberculatus]XP_045130625.1 ras-related protein Rab-37-like [Portunus trituberculatus]XP_045130635.1 ras-related protein Rab-37-like [Portunus trituberculatus]